jgi:hypothetical protein
LSDLKVDLGTVYGAEIDLEVDLGPVMVSRSTSRVFFVNAVTLDRPQGRLQGAQRSRGDPMRHGLQ